MHKTLTLAALLLSTRTACAGAQPWIPLRSGAPDPAQLTLVWVGRGECERLEGGAWVRHPEFDYDFTVEQRRMGDRWESVKSLRRRDPGYDGSAGERLQTYFFRLDLAPQGAAQPVQLKVTSTLGDGAGAFDREFRRATLEFGAAGVSSLAPFDRYRITQAYDYEQGQLSETVELNKGEQPWVRNRESATLFGARTFDRAPTLAQAR